MSQDHEDLRKSCCKNTLKSDELDWKRVVFTEDKTSILTGLMVGQAIGVTHVLNRATFRSI